MAHITDIDLFAPIPIDKRYPWDTWMDGHIWQLTAGEDFTCKPGSFAIQARRAARERGMRLRIRSLPDMVLLKAYKPEP